jgi:hypothetical protein
MPRVTAAYAATQAARTELKTAPRLDAQRDAAAAAAGKELPEGRERLEAQAAETLRLAEQRQAAESQLLMERQVAYAEAISDEHNDWSPSQGRDHRGGRTARASDSSNSSAGR